MVATLDLKEMASDLEMATAGLTYDWRVELTDIGEGRLSVEVDCRERDADPDADPDDPDGMDDYCAGSQVVGRAARRVDAALRELGYAHLTNADGSLDYGHHGGYTSWVVKRASVA